MWSYSELEWLVPQWSELLCGGRVQNVVLREGSLSLEIYSRGQLWCLTYCYQARKSLLFVWPLTQPLRGPSRQHPLVLFMRAHVVGHRLRELKLVIPKERVVEASFFAARIQWWLIPGVSQCVVQAEEKKVCLFPPRELPKQAPALGDENLGLKSSEAEGEPVRAPSSSEPSSWPSSSFMEWQKHFFIQQLGSPQRDDWQNHFYKELLWLYEQRAGGLEFIDDLPPWVVWERLPPEKETPSLRGRPRAQNLIAKLQTERERKLTELSAWQRVHDLLTQGRREEAKYEWVRLIGDEAPLSPTQERNWSNEFYEKWRQKKDKLYRLEEKLRLAEAQAALTAHSPGVAEEKQLLKESISSERAQSAQLELGATAKSSRQSQVSYRTLRLHGFEIRYTRSGPENLKLLRAAQPWDFWIHNRWYPGAFFILMRPHKNHSGPTESQWREILGEILRVEKRQESEYLVTEVRYVQPIKGAKPGLVRYREEKVYRVHI